MGAFARDSGFVPVAAHYCLTYGTEFGVQDLEVDRAANGAFSTIIAPYGPGDTWRVVCVGIFSEVSGFIVRNSHATVASVNVSLKILEANAKYKFPSPEIAPTNTK